MANPLLGINILLILCLVLFIVLYILNFFKVFKSDSDGGKTKPKPSDGGTTTTQSDGGTTTTQSDGGTTTTQSDGGTTTTPSDGGTSTTPSNGGTSTTPVNLDKSEFLKFMEKFISNLPNMLAGAAIEVGIISFLKSITNPRAFIRGVINAYDVTTDAARALRNIEINILSEINYRFNLYLKSLKFTVQETLRMLKYLPKTLKIVASKIKGVTPQMIRNGITNSINSIRAAQIGTRLAAGASRTGLALGRAVLFNPIEITMLAVTGLGMYMDQVNYQGMMDWKNYTTSELLIMKREFYKLQQQDFIRNKFPLPAISGPLTYNYSNEQLVNETSTTWKLLLFLPPLNETNISDDFSDYANCFNNDENHPKLLKVREIKSRFYNEYYKTNPSIDTISVINYMDVYVKTTQGFDDFKELYKIASFILCRLNGGNPLGDGQCSFRTATECRNSFKYLDVISLYEDELITPLIVVKSPCPSSPCLGLASSPCSTSPCFDSIIPTKKDGIYAEWRNNPRDILRLDYPGCVVGSPCYDYSNDEYAQNGVCIIVPSEMRSICKTLIKERENTNDAGNPIVGTNDYNDETGECTNNRSFCKAYAVGYKTEAMGSGMLPTCYLPKEQEAFSWAFGEIIVQFFKAGWEAFVEASESVWGIGRNSINAIIAENKRIAFEQNLNSLRYGNILNVSYVTYQSPKNGRENIYQVDFKYDNDGNYYCLYCYGDQNCELYLICYTRFFEKKYTSIHITPPEYRPYMLNSTLLAIDDDNNLYMIEFELANSNKFLQKVTKRNSSGRYDNVNWTDLRPEEYDRDQNLRRRRFNSIFFKNNCLYFTYIAYNISSRSNISRLVKYDLSNNTWTTITTPTDYLRYLIHGEMVQSFVVDSQENHYAFVYATNSIINDGVTSVNVKNSNGQDMCEYDIRYINGHNVVGQCGALIGVDCNTFQCYNPPGVAFRTCEKIEKRCNRIVSLSQFKNSILTKYDKNGNKTEYNIDFINDVLGTLRSFYGEEENWQDSMKIRNLLKYPQITIDDLDNIYVSCGYSIFKLNKTTNIFEIYAYDLYVYVRPPINNPNSESDIINHKLTSSFGNEICTSVSMKYHQIVNYSGSIMNEYNKDYPDRIIKSLTLDTSNAKIGNDYIFLGEILRSSNCFDIDTVTIFIDPPPFLTNSVYTCRFDDLVNNSYIPQKPLSMVFTINGGINTKNYNVSVKIDDQLVSSFVVEVPHPIENPEYFTLGNFEIDINRSTLNKIQFTSLLEMNCGRFWKINISPNVGNFPSFVFTNQDNIEGDFTLVRGTTYTLVMNCIFSGEISDIDLSRNNENDKDYLFSTPNAISSFQIFDGSEENPPRRFRKVFTFTL